MNTPIKLNEEQIQSAAEELCNFNKTDANDETDLFYAKDRIQSLLRHFSVNECLAIHAALTAFDDDLPF